MPDVITECPEELSPREIVARLHAEIAALSPGHAALVAAFEQRPRKPGYPIRAARRPAGYRSAARLRRLAVYSSLRLSGSGLKAAARRAGLRPDIGRQYEADMLAALGGEL